MTLPRLWTTLEVADHTRLTVPTIATAIRRGELPARRVGRRWLVAEPDVAAWLDAQPSNAGIRDALAGAR